MVSQALYTSARTGAGSDCWATPLDLWQLLRAEFEITFDLAANESNHLCTRWYGPGGEREDALAGPWDLPAPAFLNPPYSLLREFMAKVAAEAKRGQPPIVCLIPARTDTRAWHESVTQATEIRFLKGRLKFGGAATGAPFPSAVVIFYEGWREGDFPAVKWWDWRKDFKEWEEGK